MRETRGVRRRAVCHIETYRVSGLPCCACRSHARDVGGEGWAGECVRTSDGIGWGGRREGSGNTGGGSCPVGRCETRFYDPSYGQETARGTISKAPTIGCGTNDGPSDSRPEEGTERDIAAYREQAGAKPSCREVLLCVVDARSLEVSLCVDGRSVLSREAGRYRCVWDDLCSAERPGGITVCRGRPVLSREAGRYRVLRGSLDPAGRPGGIPVC